MYLYIVRHGQPYYSPVEKLTWGQMFLRVLQSVCLG